MFSLKEALALTAITNSTNLHFYKTNADFFYWVNNSTKVEAQLLEDADKYIATNSKLLNLTEEKLNTINNYFTYKQLTCIKINATCTRIYLEDSGVNPEQIFEKIKNKTIYIVYTKGGDRLRTGPFVFKNINTFFEKVFMFGSTSEINSGGFGSVQAIAYIDLY